MSASAGLTVHLLDLGQLGEPLDRAEAMLHLLAADEPASSRSSSAAAWSAERRRTRIALRLALAARGFATAFATPFDIGLHGKPALRGVPLHFSVSHSAARALVALAASGPVGVDLEVGRNRSIAPARRAQLIAAASALGAHLPEAGTVDRELLAAWTALESFAKAEALGIGALLTALGILGPGSRTREPGTIAQTAADYRCRTATALSVVLSQPEPDLIAAICAPTSLLADNDAVPRPLTSFELEGLVRSASTHLPIDRSPSPRHKEPGNGA